ncbi:MAG: hypothetical protein RLZZ342_271 [Candidatus Parcubacteria bacterium]|jgi:hypothetical protein
MQSITASLIAILASLQALSATQVPSLQHPTPTVLVAPRAATPPAVVIPRTNVVLLVSGTSTARYEFTVATNTTLATAMHSLASTTAFRFTAREYSGMGMFVDSIHGVRNANGLYWILRINGKKSDVGASSLVLRSGDTVEWRYEKGY